MFADCCRKLIFSQRLLAFSLLYSAHTVESHKSGLLLQSPCYCWRASHFLVKGERVTILQFCPGAASETLLETKFHDGLKSAFDSFSHSLMLTELPNPMHCNRARWLAYCSTLKSLHSCSTTFSRFIIDHLGMHYANPILFISSLFDHKIENKSNPSIFVSHLPRAQAEQSVPSGGRRWRRPRGQRR